MILHKEKFCKLYRSRSFVIIETEETMMNYACGQGRMHTEFWSRYLLGSRHLEDLERKRRSQARKFSQNIGKLVMQKDKLLAV